MQKTCEFDDIHIMYKPPPRIYSELVIRYVGPSERPVLCV